MVGNSQTVHLGVVKDQLLVSDVNEVLLKAEVLV
jgi:hypothetical protein